MRVATIPFLRWMGREAFGNSTLEQIYDDIAKDDYDYSIDYNARVRGLLNALKNTDVEPDRILDLACGTGAFIQALYSNFPQANITGIDISSQMLHVARRRFVKNKRIKLQRMDMNDLLFKTQSFDMVTAAFATRFVPRKNEIDFFRSIAEVLKPNGTFIIATSEPILGKRALQLVERTTGIPKGFNLTMNYTNYLKLKASSCFTFQEKTSILKRYGVLQSYMLVFKKK